MATHRSTYLTDFIADQIVTAYRASRGAPPSEELVIRPSDRPEFGDFTTNIAMIQANKEGMNPRSLAEELVQAIGASCSDEGLSGCEAAGPGFINLFLSPQRIQNALRHILERKDTYGRQDRGGGRRLQVEFVSSNPTGPLTVGHGRQAVLGDVLSTLGEWLGWNVHREYYFNDEGRQIELLTDSTAERILESAFSVEAKIPENGYEGEYLREIAREILTESADAVQAIAALRAAGIETPSRSDLYEHLDTATLRNEAIQRIIRTIKEDLARLGVRFDMWFSETTLHRSGAVDAALETLREQDGVYDNDGAIWLRAEQYGGAKDSVLIRSDGRPTYLMVDIAYHINKKARGFDHVIDVQGADHHAEQTCVQAALRMLEIPESFLDYETHQFVSLKENGEVQRMSTRAGRFVTLRDLIDDLGKDVIRFFMISRKPEAHLDFDLDLARAESLDNPVTYIQYAHTRIASIFAKAGASVTDWATVDLSPLVEPIELELIKQLDRFPEIVRIAAEEFSPHLLAEYALDVSRAFHSYYDKHRVLTDTERLTEARLALLSALQMVLRSSLTILGMDAPLEM